MGLIYATPQGEHTVEEVEAALRAEIKKLREEPIGEEELARARKTLRADAIRALKTNLGLASLLAAMFQMSGDPYYLEQRLRQLEAVGADLIMDFARTYLTDANLTVGIMEPPAGDEQTG